MIYTCTSGGGGESASRKDFRQPPTTVMDAVEVVQVAVVEVAVADDRGGGRSL